MSATLREQAHLYMHPQHDAGQPPPIGPSVIRPSATSEYQRFHDELRDIERQDRGGGLTVVMVRAWP